MNTRRLMTRAIAAATTLALSGCVSARDPGAASQYAPPTPPLTRAVEFVAQPECPATPPASPAPAGPADDANGDGTSDLWHAHAMRQFWRDDYAKADAEFNTAMLSRDHALLKAGGLAALNAIAEADPSLREDLYWARDQVGYQNSAASIRDATTKLRATLVAMISSVVLLWEYETAYAALTGCEVDPDALSLPPAEEPPVGHSAGQFD